MDKLWKKFFFDSFYIKNSKYDPPHWWDNNQYGAPDLQRLVLTQKVRDNTKRSNTTPSFKNLNKTTNWWLGGWFFIQKFCNKLFTNKFVQSTFVVCFHYKYVLILQKTHCNTLTIWITLNQLYQLLLLWLTAYLQGDCSHHAELPLFSFSMQFSIFAVYQLFGLCRLCIPLYKHLPFMCCV